MAYFRSFSQMIPLSHIPTIFLIVGYMFFWLELYLVRLPYGHCSWTAWGVSLVFFLSVCWMRRAYLNQLISEFRLFFKAQPLMLKMGMLVVAAAGAVYIFIVAYAASLPPHLIQEHDALNYHIMLPRQHLLMHSFTHISWSTFDLLLTPLDYALAPFILATALPNKLIHFIFFVGCLVLIFKIVHRLTQGDYKRSSIAVVAVMASHLIAIQAGTAMMDLVMLYCFCACIHSLLQRQMGLAAIEAGLYIWSKSFIPVQVLLVGIILYGIYLLAKRNGFVLLELTTWTSKQGRRFWAVFCIVSVLIAGPFLLKSFYYTGTPLYPFGVGVVAPLKQYTPAHWQGIDSRAQQCIAVRNDYGHGRSWGDFIKHIWLIAVPEKGVNNAFDYPVGLVYLLMLVPFLMHCIQSIMARRFPVLSLITILFWLSWWFGSQQTRFLMVPLTIMTIITLTSIQKISKILVFLIIGALMLEIASLVNAHRIDWGKPVSVVMRDKDRKLMAMSVREHESIDLDYPDIAFAPFVGRVHNDHSIYVIP